MSAHKPFLYLRSCTYLGAVLLGALLGAVLAGTAHPVYAAQGYWKYSDYVLSPSSAQLAEIKPAPGRVHELRGSGGVQPGPESGKGSIDLFFKTDDADRVLYQGTSTLSFGASTSLETLLPGQKVTFQVSISAEGNDKARALNGSARGGLWVDNGDYAAQAETPLGSTQSAEGLATIPGGGPGSTMTVNVKSHLSHNGAVSQTLTMNYVWIATADPVAAPPAAVPSSGAWAGTWDTAFGTMVLQQQGSGITGTYDYKDGRIEGMVQGAELRGYWVQANAQGRFVFNLSADGQSFSGTWGYGESTTDGGWTGTRR
jgi:hypothetical protein